MCQISGCDDARLVNKDFEDGLTTTVVVKVYSSIK